MASDGEDEDLDALRKAALATLKNPQPVGQVISSISSIGLGRTPQSNQWHEFPASADVVLEFSYHPEPISTPDIFPQPRHIQVPCLQPSPRVNLTQQPPPLTQIPLRPQEWGLRHFNNGLLHNKTFHQHGFHSDRHNFQHRRFHSDRHNFQHRRSNFDRRNIQPSGSHFDSRNFQPRGSRMPFGERGRHMHDQDRFSRRGIIERGRQGFSNYGGQGGMPEILVQDAVAAAGNLIVVHKPGPKPKKPGANSGLSCNSSNNKRNGPGKQITTTAPPPTESQDKYHGSSAGAKPVIEIKDSKKKHKLRDKFSRYNDSDSEEEEEEDWMDSFREVDDIAREIDKVLEDDSADLAQLENVEPAAATTDGTEDFDVEVGSLEFSDTEEQNENVVENTDLRSDEEKDSVTNIVSGNSPYASDSESIDLDALATDEPELLSTDVDIGPVIPQAKILLEHFGTKSTAKCDDRSVIAQALLEYKGTEDAVSATADSRKEDKVDDTDDESSASSSSSSSSSASSSDDEKEKKSDTVEGDETSETILLTGSTIQLSAETRELTDAVENKEQKTEDNDVSMPFSEYSQTDEKSLTSLKQSPQRSRSSRSLTPKQVISRSPPPVTPPRQDVSPLNQRTFSPRRDLPGRYRSPRRQSMSPGKYRSPIRRSKSPGRRTSSPRREGKSSFSSRRSPYRSAPHRRKLVSLSSRNHSSRPRSRSPMQRSRSPPPRHSPPCRPNSPVAKSLDSRREARYNNYPDSRRYEGRAYNSIRYSDREVRGSMGTSDRQDDRSRSKHLLSRNRPDRRPGYRDSPSHRSIRSPLKLRENKKEEKKEPSPLPQIDLEKLQPEERAIIEARWKKFGSSEVKIDPSKKVSLKSIKERKKRKKSSCDHQVQEVFEKSKPVEISKHRKAKKVKGVHVEADVVSSDNEEEMDEELPKLEDESEDSDDGRAWKEEVKKSGKSTISLNVQKRSRAALVSLDRISVKGDEFSARQRGFDRGRFHSSREPVFSRRNHRDRFRMRPTLQQRREFVSENEESDETAVPSISLTSSVVSAKPFKADIPPEKLRIQIQVAPKEKKKKKSKVKPDFSHVYSVPAKRKNHEEVVVDEEDEDLFILETKVKKKRKKEKKKKEREALRFLMAAQGDMGTNEVNEEEEVPVLPARPSILERLGRKVPLQAGREKKKKKKRHSGDEPDLDLRMRKMKEKSEAILRRQREIELDKKKYG